MTSSKKHIISAFGHFTVGRTEAGEFVCTGPCVSKRVEGLWVTWPPSVISCILREIDDGGGRRLSLLSSLETKPKCSYFPSVLRPAFCSQVFMSTRVQDLLALEWFSNFAYKFFFLLIKPLKVIVWTKSHCIKQKKPQNFIGMYLFYNFTLTFYFIYCG